MGCENVNCVGLKLTKNTCVAPGLEHQNGKRPSKSRKKNTSVTVKQTYQEYRLFQRM